MKQLLFAFMLLAVIKSNGQDKKDTTKMVGKYFTGTVNARSFINLQDSIHEHYIIFFSPDNKTSAYLKSGSDTLEVFDSVIQLYGSKIRYIKTMNGSIIKL